MALNNISSTIEQIKTRLEFLLKNDSTKQLDVRNYFLFFLKLFYEFLFNQNLNQNAEIQFEWDNQLNSFRVNIFYINKPKRIVVQNEIQNLNQSTKIYLEQLTNLVHNSSDKV